LMGPASAAEFQAGDEYPSDSAEDSDEDDQKDKSEKDDASNGDKPAPVPTGPIPQGKSADFWTLAAVASREDGDPQGQADVAQSIYNRLASGAYGGKTIKDLLISTWQYEPTWRYPNGPTRGDGNPNPQWLNISDIKSAAAAVGASENHVASAAKAITNSGLQAKAAEFVQGRTDFTGYSKRARRGQIQRKRGDNYFGWDWNYAGKGIAKVPSFSGVKLASAGGIIPLFMSGGGEYNPKSGMVQPSMKDFNFIPNEEAITDRKKKMSMILQSLAGGGMIKVDGDGSGWTGTLSMYQGGAKVGKSYKARSGISSKRNVSQKDRFHTKMSPHPDGTYSLVGADYHGHIMAGLGDWSVYIGNSSGSLGSRSGLMFHNDIGNNGTAGCIGIDVGGAAGTKADKDFWKQYQEIKPSKMLINLLGKGAGKVDDLGDQSSGPASNSSSSSSSSSSSGGASGGAAPAENNWWDTLGAALSGDTARKMLGVSSPAAAGTGTPAAGTGTPAAGTPGGKTSTGVPSEPKITTNPDGSVSATTYKYDLGSKELEGFTRKGGPDIVDIAKKEQAMFYEQEVSRLGGGADAGFPADHPLRRAAGGSNDLTKLSTEQLKKMLRTDLTPTDAEFAAAKKAREEGKLKGLSGEALEREVLMATINAKQGTPQAEIKPATPATPTGSQVLQQSAQLKDAKSGEAAKPQVSTINNNQGTSGGGGGGGGTIAINTAGGTNKNNTDFLVPMGHPFRNMVSSEALAAIK